MSMTTASGLPLDTLVADIEARVIAGDRDTKRGADHHKAAGIQLIELKARVRAELPGASWLTWAATNFPRIGLGRIEVLMQIGRGDVTQAELNARSSSYQRPAAPRQTEPPQQPPAAQFSTMGRDDAQEDARRAARAALRSARIAAGANLPPPLMPLEYRRLLKTGREKLALLDFEKLRAAISYIEATYNV